MRQSRKPAMGDRVIVRRRLPNVPGHFTDVIGHVARLQPLTVVPQSVGGFASQAEAIVIPDELIEVVKVLPPRRVMNRDIRAIETATAKAFPGIEHTWAGQWLMRAGDGITERSNSAVPLGRSAGLTPVPLAAIEAFYARHHLPTRLLIPDRIGATAATLIKAGGWQLGPDIIVMAADLSQPTPTPHELADGMSVRITDQPDEQWLTMYHFRGQPLPRHALQLLMDRIEGTLAFAAIVDENTGHTVAITRATITSSEDGKAWLGFSAVEVKQSHRRQGLATALGTAVLNWGREHGADGAYLQVIASNEPGIGLYTKLGFLEHHRHRCATKLDG